MPARAFGAGGSWVHKQSDNEKRLRHAFVRNYPRGQRQCYRVTHTKTAVPRKKTQHTHTRTYKRTGQGTATNGSNLRHDFPEHDAFGQVKWLLYWPKNRSTMTESLRSIKRRQDSAATTGSGSAPDSTDSTYLQTVAGTRLTQNRQSTRLHSSTQMPTKNARFLQNAVQVFMK